MLGTQILGSAIFAVGFALMHGIGFSFHFVFGCFGGLQQAQVQVGSACRGILEIKLGDIVTGGQRSQFVADPAGNTSSPDVTSEGVIWTEDCTLVSLSTRSLGCKQ